MEEYIKKAKMGHKESFIYIMDSVKDKAYRTAYSYLKDENDSMDAVCNSIEIAYKKLKQLKKPEYFDTWFIRIVINECHGFLKEREKVDGLVNRLSQSMADELGDMEQSLVSIDIREHLDQLDPINKKIIYMRYWMDLKLGDIAKQLGLPSNTVKTKLYRSLGGLREQLREGR